MRQTEFENGGESKQIAIIMRCVRNLFILILWFHGELSK